MVSSNQTVKEPKIFSCHIWQRKTLNCHILGAGILRNPSRGFSEYSKYRMNQFSAVPLNTFLTVTLTLICQQDGLSTGSNLANSGSLHLERWPCKIVGIPLGEGRGWREWFPPKVKHGNDYLHCCWYWVVSLSLVGWNEHTMQSICFRRLFECLILAHGARGFRGVGRLLLSLIGGEALHAYLKNLEQTWSHSAFKCSENWTSQHKNTLTFLTTWE